LCSRISRSHSIRSDGKLAKGTTLLRIKLEPVDFCSTLESVYHRWRDLLYRMTQACYPNSARLLLQLAFLASAVSFAPWGVHPSKKAAFFHTETHACDQIIVLSSSLSSDPHPPETPPSNAVVERAAFFATPENKIEDDVDSSNVETAATPTSSNYTQGDAARLELNEEFLEWGNKALEHVIVSHGVSISSCCCAHHRAPN
jgi:hypothetical protein